MIGRKKNIVEELMDAPLFAPEQLKKQLGNSLILAPHPDDEALGCGGLIQYLLEQNTGVHLCFVTSGDASHRNSKKYPPIELGKLRENEARNACEILGIKSSNIIFLRQPDSRLKDLKQKQRLEVIKQLADILMEFEISSLLLPWRRDPHPDHRASFDFGKKAVEICGGQIQLVEYPIWLWKNSSSEDWPLKNEVEMFRLDISPKMEKKKRAIYAHVSQTSWLIDDDPEGFILTDDLLSPFLDPFEFYFFNKEEKLKSLSKSYFDALYSHNPDPWNFRTSEYEQRKYGTINNYLENRKYNSGLELGCSIGEHTAHLASHCGSLLAVDISERAIATAKEENNLPNVHYKNVDIIQEFPKGPFDFISMCEIGYYFDRENLISIFRNISENLNENGHFLMVHWTSYVREYPLNGKLVHQIFREFNERINSFSLISSFTDDRYELLLWEKRT